MKPTGIIKHNDKLYVKNENDLFVSFTELTIPEMKPQASFKGARIPFTLWQQIVSFLLWSYAEFKSEALVQLFYSEELQEWRAWVMPQYIGTGMTITQVTDADVWDKFEEEQRQYIAGFDPAGSVHHHCTASAFQSGTDHNDEKNKQGLHITIGNLDASRLSIHGRVSVNKVFWTPSWLEWFELPEQFMQAALIFPDEAINLALERLLTLKPETLEFPALWKDNCMKRVYTSSYSERDNRYGAYLGNGTSGIRNHVKNLVGASYYYGSLTESLFRAIGEMDKLDTEVSDMSVAISMVAQDIDELVGETNAVSVTLPTSELIDISTRLSQLEEDLNNIEINLRTIFEHIGGEVDSRTFYGASVGTGAYKTKNEIEKFLKDGWDWDLSTDIGTSSDTSYNGRQLSLAEQDNKRLLLEDNNRADSSIDPDGALAEGFADMSDDDYEDYLTGRGMFSNHHRTPIH